MLFTPRKGVDRLGDSQDEEIVILPSEDSSDSSPGAKLDITREQWDQVIGVVNRLSHLLTKTRSTFGIEVCEVEDKLLKLDARVGVPPPGQKFEDCGSVWDGLSMIENNTQELKSSVDEVKTSSLAATQNLGGSIV